MKILSDFDGVLTDLGHEADRVRELFSRDFARLTGIGPGDVSQFMGLAEAAMTATPYAHGWKVGPRITAFCNEDGFIRMNAMGACLDEWVSEGRAELAALAQKLKISGIPSFRDLAQSAYGQMVQETAAGKLKPIDPATKPVLQALLDRGVEVVVVSNSGTERICQLLTEAGLDAHAHAEGLRAPLRVRGNARKFILGNSPRCFDVGQYSVDTDRPDYEKIILEEKPDVVIGDVFSLDLALPLYLATQTRSGLDNLQVVLRKREYTPQWSLDYVTSGVERGERGVFDRLDQLLELD